MTGILERKLSICQDAVWNVLFAGRPSALPCAFVRSRPSSVRSQSEHRMAAVLARCSPGASGDHVTASVVRPECVCRGPRHQRM
jgi:hypothetical protein